MDESINRARKAAHLLTNDKIESVVFTPTGERRFPGNYREWVRQEDGIFAQGPLQIFGDIFTVKFKYEEPAPEPGLVNLREMACSSTNKRDGLRIFLLALIARIEAQEEEIVVLGARADLSVDTASDTLKRLNALEKWAETFGQQP